MFGTLGAVAACLALVMLTTTLASGIWLFMPYSDRYPDVSQYETSEYYDVIVKLNKVTYSPTPYKNNFEKYLAKITNAFDGFDYLLNSKDAADDMNGAAGGSALLGGTDRAPTSNESLISTDNNNNNKYDEVTDNQVAGIIEADRIKKSLTHAFYLDNDTLKIFYLDGTNTEKVGEVVVENSEYTYKYSYDWEFYLSNDCKTVTVIGSGYARQSGSSYIDVISIDVSDPTSPKQTGCVSFKGNYLSSRVVDGKLILLTNFNVGRNPDFSNEAEFLPQCDIGEGMVSIPAKDIVAPDELSSASYAVVYKLDVATLALEGNSAFLSCSQNVYVSHSAAYLTRSFEKATDSIDGKYTSTTMTEIFILAYKDGFEYKGSVTVEGYIKDQYSLDEHDGILRVVTTTSTTEGVEQVVGDTVSWSGASKTNADLVCIDLSDLSVKAHVKSFAPEGETVRSVRFDGDAAYVCTSIQLSDPVFFFDLSDLSSITVKDTGTIEGFSSSLINFGNGYLLGIGQGSSWSTFKVEIYEETETGVRSVCSYELDNAYYSTNYKSYYIDRENSLVGLGVQVMGQTKYVVLLFDKNTLHTLVDTPLMGDLSHMRGFYADEYFYMFGSNDYGVEHIG